MDILISNNEIRLNGQSYLNIIRLSDIYEIIEKDRYNSYYQTVKARNKQIEDDKHHGIPMMNAIFYSRFAYCTTISHQLFLNEYKRVHCIRLKDGEMKFNSNNSKHQYIFYEKELDGKLLRGYMSFLKELFVLYSLIDKKIPAKYSLQTDINGFDIIAQNYNGHKYGIRIFSKTEKAQSFAKQKEEERHNYQNSSCTAIVLQAQMATEVIGDTYVFTQNQMNNLYNHIHNDRYETIVL